MINEITRSLPEFMKHLHLVLSNEVQDYIQELRDIIDAQSKELMQPVPKKPRRMGVSYRKSRDKWYARCQIDGHQTTMTFDTYEDAVEARRLAEYRHPELRRAVYPLTEIEIDPDTDYVTTKVRHKR